MNRKLEDLICSSVETAKYAKYGERVSFPVFGVFRTAILKSFLATSSINIA